MSKNSIITNKIMIAKCIGIMIFVLAFLFIQPTHVLAQQIPPLINCRFSPNTPQMDTEMNSVSVGNKIKTIHVDKGRFDCQSPNVPGGEFVYKVDVSTYIEKNENLANLSSVPKKTFEAVTCVKEVKDGTVVGCQKSSSIPSTLPNTALCTLVDFPFPIEMNSLSTTNGLMKSIEAETGHFACTTNSPIFIDKHVTIFTETYSSASGTIKKTFESVTCAVDMSTTKLLACKASSTGVL
jgi:hypothetical protein